MVSHLSGFRFVANLKPYTVHRGAGNQRFGAYLLSIDYARAFADLAREVVTGGSVLCADNGNVGLIRALIASHTAGARALGSQRALLRRSRPGDLPAALRKSHLEFATLVRHAAKAAVDRDHIVDVVRAQSAMNPTYLIGMEDFTLATLTALGIEPEFLGGNRRFYESLAKRAVEFAVDTTAGKYGATSGVVFAGVHASDYDTALLAGRVAGAAGVHGIATGMVGALQDNSYVDYVLEDEQVVELGQPVPRPYLRVAQIAAGLHEGFVQGSGRRPAFHALGVGSPILLPLLAALGDGSTYTATDSTAPIVDGWSGATISLYVATPAPLKYKAYRIVEEWIANDRAWDCPCPYCRGFDRAFAPRIEEARRWWHAHGKPKVTAASMRSNGPLSGWLPLFGNAADPGLRLTGAMARVGHNHWVLQRIESEARRHGGSHDARIAWTDSVVRAYTTWAADPQWKLAVEAAWKIIRRAALATRSARPTPLES